MKVIICGGRDFADREKAFYELDQIHAQWPITLVIEGGARGADRIGRNWARMRNIPFQTVNADWDTHGKRAGWLRNVAMADLKPDGVIALPGGVGTKMMLDIAKQRNIPTCVIT
jgi:hypothetical protein